MQLTERRSEGLLRVYDVVVPAAELQQKLNAKIAEVQPRVRINGFRPGKVPTAHIRKMYGPSMMQDIINEMVQSSTRESLQNLRAASEPSLDLKSDINQVVAGTADLQFELSLEIMPEFEPVDLKTISIARPVSAVTEAQVQEQLEELAKAQRGFMDKDGAAAEGDAVIIDFVGRIDGEAFEGGAADDAQVVIGSNQFIPGFEEQLVGVKAGEERTLKVSFPENYGASHLAGKAAEFETKVKAVRQPKEGAPDDAWAAQLGFESLTAIKDALKQRIETEHTQQSRAKAKRVLFDKLDAGHSFELPPRMVEAEFNQIWRQVEADKNAGRADPSDADKSDDELKAEYRAIAERRVRLGLLLAEVGKRAKVDVSREELGQAIVREAQRYPGQERKVIDYYQQNQDAMAQLRAPIYEDKVVDYILALAKVTDKAVTPKELAADAGAEGADAAKADKEEAEGGEDKKSKSTKKKK